MRHLLFLATTTTLLFLYINECPNYGILPDRQLRIKASVHHEDTYTCQYSYTRFFPVWCRFYEYIGVLNIMKPVLGDSTSIERFGLRFKTIDSVMDWQENQYNQIKEDFNNKVNEKPRQ